VRSGKETMVRANSSKLDRAAGNEKRLTPNAGVSRSYMDWANVRVSGKGD
jgi:hypothetical protein